ncbi:MAG: ATP-dependent RecD-like DNA helicase [Planctomycetes bacterium]|nr:ATP-dependent RecD-like DNA helicase [Planctomycetota bacterium]MBT4029785.1 ATP-dependent RecD-like DNA helicase [Planctomycetota bacterium]MBT4559824.1 ATP-dependent RecD-like DNA helicase [Planctomycetota bacterium]MBT5101594.1 ATP-dependent RecD-like DNA helicase [Planctomycetota bacterium]MBT7318330.1 ATP-dependent RecD-like DNA helicase [Planctomycetota bacterium]
MPRPPAFDSSSRRFGGDEKDDAHETLEGTIGYVVYASDDSDYLVARFETDEGLTTIAGSIGPLEGGENLRLHGRWTEHPKFGKQFQATWSEVATPTTLTGMKKYLGSGVFPGIGPDLASKLVDHFGIDTLDALDEGKARLREVEGIGPKRAQTLMDGFSDGRDRHRVFSELRGLGLNAMQSNSLYEKWQAGAIDRVREDPYALCDMLRGFGFRTAERIAEQVGIERDSVVRARGVLQHLLREGMQQGHACMPEDDLLQQMQEVGMEIETILEAIKGLVDADRLRIGGEPRMHYLPEMWNAEIGVADNILRLLDGEASCPATADQIESAVRRATFTPDESQRRAVEMALESPFAVMTGGPGTGKTTTLRLLLEIYDAAGFGPVELASPTGRAAKRLQEATGRKASTIHRLLGFDPMENGFRHNEDNPIDARVLVLDEVSMLDLPLAHALLRATADGCRVLFVGDADQLPSVGPGSVLRDLVASAAIPTTRLARIHRQDQGSGIIEAAHAILEGCLPETATSGGSGDFFLSIQDDAEQAATMVEKIVCERIPGKYDIDPMQDVLVLAPMYRGALGVDALNDRLAASLNPDGAAGPEWANGLRVGDRIMIVRNDYDREVFNGDTGIVLAIGTNNVSLEVGGYILEYKANEMHDFIRSYCVTVHRSQGSEAKAVVVVLGSSHYMMLRRNLLYTAVTRGKDLVVVVANRQALRQAVSNATENLRHGQLQQRLAVH